MGVSVRFWGVRGTIPCPLATHMAFGGNTSCVEVTAGSQRIVFDAGTGIRLLGRQMMAEQVSHATLLLSHTHLDHISGFPFFTPAFQPGFEFRVVAGHLKGNRAGYPDLQSVLARQMARPLFPVPLKTMGCNLEFQEITAGDRFALDDAVTVRTAPLNHPDGATGYRVEHGGRSVAYVTDTEHIPGQTDQCILDLIADADLVIYDATYTDEEFACKIGWGHSTWREGVRLARLAGAARLALFHHEPDHDDDIMDTIERDARSLWPACFAAREGMTVTL